MSKKLSVGVTINLDNYENLRVELEGEVEDVKDASSLISSLDFVLSTMGRNDPYAAERIDTYRKKVLSQPTQVILPPQKPRLQQTTFTREQVSAREDEPMDHSCSKCGSAITKSQAKLAQLVKGQELCKKCMGEK